MAIGSRSYARPYLAGGGLPTAVKALLIANTAMFLLLFFGRSALNSVMAALALSPAAVVHSLAIWQPFTYLFLHVGILGFVFNMLALWMFGRELEDSWGTVRFLQFYFLCGCGAALFAIAVSYAFGDSMGIIIGSTGAIYGILAASAALWPERELIFFFFPMKMKYFVLLIAVIDFLVTYGSVGQMALLTGLPIGYLYVKTPSRRRSGRKVDLMGSMRASYRDWKLKRAKRKFQVYLKKQGSDRGPFVN